VVELAGEGTQDIVYSARHAQIPTNVEVLILVGQAVYAAGNAGNNILWGNELANSIYGSTGIDELRGWAGADQFVFLPQSGSDYGLGNTTIDDFALNENDTIIFDHSFFSNFDAMLSHATANAAGAVILQASQSATVTLWGVSLDDIHAHQDHFYFI
jgi:Ca2+-binding RTX toxin-like protein